MKEKIFKSLHIYKRFIKLLVEYVRLNMLFSLKYLSILIADSFAKIFSVVSMAPLVDFLSSNNNASSQGITLFFQNTLSQFGFEYTLASSIVVFIIGTILGLLTEIIFFSVNRRNAYKIQYHFISGGMKKFFERGLNFINSQSFGVIQNTFQREISQVSDGVADIALLISNLIQILFMLVLAFSLSVSMTVITLLFLSLIFITMYSSSSSLIKKLSTRATISGNELSQALFEPLLNAKQVLSFGRSEHAYINHSRMYEKHTNDAISSQIAAYSIPLIFRTFGIIATLVALYIALSLGENAATLVIALVSLIRITPIASQVVASLATINVAVPSLDQFERLFGYIFQRQQATKLKEFDGFLENIQLIDITYSHSPERKSLIGTNLIIKKNSHVSFVGPSGSGKTTCVDILIGLLKPSSGHVLIDQNPLKEVNLDSFLAHVGYVQQTPFLFNGSIKDNLLWSNPNATEDEMWDALCLANIDSFVRSTKRQLDTFVGERGVSMSGGQKQRIALALALVRHPSILILDEATNSLDYESEYSIVKALEKISHKVTIISITHQPSMAINSDQVFVFSEGEIIESGSYNDLIDNKKSFLYKMKHKKI